MDAIAHHSLDLDFKEELLRMQASRTAAVWPYVLNSENTRRPNSQYQHDIRHISHSTATTDNMPHRTVVAARAAYVSPPYVSPPYVSHTQADPDSISGVSVETIAYTGRKRQRPDLDQFGVGDGEVTPKFEGRMSTGQQPRWIDDRDVHVISPFHRGQPIDNPTVSTYRQGVVQPGANRGEDIASNKRRRISIVSGNEMNHSIHSIPTPGDHNPYPGRQSSPRNVNSPPSPSPSSSSSFCPSSAIPSSPKPHPAIPRTTSSRSPPTLTYRTFDGLAENPHTDCDCHPSQWSPTTHRPVPPQIHHSTLGISYGKPIPPPAPMSRFINCRHCNARVLDHDTVRCQCGDGICIACTQSYGERRGTDHDCSWDNSRPLPLPESFASRAENSELSPAIEPSPPVQRGITLTTHRRNASRWYINMLDTHECGYCHMQFPHLIALQAHLNQTPFHDVFWCCQRLFKKSQDLMQHADKVHGKKWVG